MISNIYYSIDIWFVLLKEDSSQTIFRKSTYKPFLVLFYQEHIAAR